MIAYKKLWKLLIDKGMTKTELRQQIDVSTVTLSRLSKGENITTDVINKICELFDCQPGDIMEYVDEVNNEQ